MHDELIRQLLLRQKEMAENILAYPAPDYAAYMLRVGEYQGINQALEMIQGLEEEHNRDPDA